MREAIGGTAMPLDFHDFFSGCGGTSRGMQAAGMAIRLGIDVDPGAKETYEANFNKAKFLCEDIRRLKVKDLSRYIRRRYGRPLVFGACAPCQPFSKQNRLKDEEDGRRTLLREFHRFVQGYLPEYLFIENVPGLQAVDASEGPFADFLHLLERLDYWHAHKIIMGYHYGVPQRRRRLVLVASRLGPIEFPPPTHGPGTDTPSLPTVWEWIGHLPPIKAGETHPNIANHRAAELSELNLQRISGTPEGGDRTDWPDELALECHKKHTGHTDVYGRMLKDQPSAALTTRCISLSNGRFGHPTQNRAISVREAACIQTFPMDFELHGTLNSMARQVGNAVPVEMARIFGEAIIRHYQVHKTQKTT